jgi:hypothetical protein
MATASSAALWGARRTGDLATDNGVLRRRCLGIDERRAPFLFLHFPIDAVLENRREAQ